MIDHFNCSLKFTSKCIDKERIDCNKCQLKLCNSCDNSWSSNVCNQCKLNKD